MSDDSHPEPTRSASAGSAYLVVPEAGRGHGVLVLHSWWGLTRHVKDVVEALADAGYTALAPDLLDGALPADGDEARDLLADTDPNQTAALVLSSIVALRAHSADPDAPIAMLGYSMGAFVVGNVADVVAHQLQRHRQVQQRQRRASSWAQRRPVDRRQRRQAHPGNRAARGQTGSGSSGILLNHQLKQSRPLLADLHI